MASSPTLLKPCAGDSSALVVQGAREPFGMPPPGPRRIVVQVAGDHSLKTDLEAVGAAVQGWLARVVARRVATE